MEKDEAQTNDFADYYGSIKQMKDMFLVLNKTSDFIEDIKRSAIYLEYEAALKELNQYPELKEKADAFRKENFMTVTSIKMPVPFSAVASMETKYEEVAVYPEIERYLNAELALCRMVQKIQSNLSGIFEF